MRLWHYKLIPVLPRKQLLSQWRECCAIASNIATKGTPNHILVNKIMDYPIGHFCFYTNEILNEMNKRSYVVKERSYVTFVENINKGMNNFHNSEVELIINGELFPGWHNERYLTQCFKNLEEKYDCGMFTEEEWNLVRSFYFSKDREVIRRTEYDTKVNKDLGILGSI